MSRVIGNSPITNKAKIMRTVVLEFSSNNLERNTTVLYRRTADTVQYLRRGMPLRNRDTATCYT